MMYIESPMEKYNKNNPFIIIAKRLYYSIIDNIHDFTKMCITFTILNIIISLTYVAINLYGIFSNVIFNVESAIVLMSIIVINNFILWYKFRKKINYFISNNEPITEFARLSELEINAIIALNNEDVLKCIYDLYELRGELTTTVKYYRIALEQYISFELILTIVTLILIL